MQLNSLQVLLTDLHISGVSDVVSDESFDFYKQKIESPFRATEPAPTQKPQKSLTEKTVSKVEINKASPQPKETPKERSLADLVWCFGAENAPVQIIISTHQPQTVHPLSIEGKILFEKMLKAIGLEESSVTYVVMNDAGVYTKSEKLQVLNYMKNLGESAFKLFVGEESVKCVFDKSLLKMRLEKNTMYENKPCGFVMHPESLRTQPALKKMAWHDLLRFESVIQGGLV